MIRALAHVSQRDSLPTGVPLYTLLKLIFFFPSSVKRRAVYRRGTGDESLCLVFYTGLNYAACRGSGTPTRIARSEVTLIFTTDEKLKKCRGTSDRVWRSAVE